MKKMTKQLFVAAVAISALTACSSNAIAELDPVDPANVEQLANAPVANSFALTDKTGQKVSSVSADFGTYYLDIKTDGAWYIETPNNMEFLPTKMAGLGSARVPVMDSEFEHQLGKVQDGHELEHLCRLWLLSCQAPKTRTVHRRKDFQYGWRIRY